MMGKSICTQNILIKKNRKTSIIVTFYILEKTKTEEFSLRA